MNEKDRETKTVAGMSDEAVRAKTGKGWEDWFAILDQAGARNMTHRAIADRLHEREGLPGWWAQMVTVGYEQARGLREKHQTPTGYKISGSKTVAVPLSSLYKAWEDPRARTRWLRDTGILVRKATSNKSMRITWVDGKTSLEVNFYRKGDDKSQVTVQHTKLRDARAAARMKAYWAETLDRLKGVLEA